MTSSCLSGALLDCAQLAQPDHVSPEPHCHRSSVTMAHTNIRVKLPAHSVVVVRCVRQTGPCPDMQVVAWQAVEGRTQGASCQEQGNTDQQQDGPIHRPVSSDWQADLESWQDQHERPGRISSLDWQAGLQAPPEDPDTQHQNLGQSTGSPSLQSRQMAGLVCSDQPVSPTHQILQHTGSDSLIANRHDQDCANNFILTANQEGSAQRAHTFSASDVEAMLAQEQVCPVTFLLRRKPLLGLQRVGFCNPLDPGQQQAACQKQQPPSACTSARCDCQSIQTCCVAGSSRHAAGLA